MNPNLTELQKKLGYNFCDEGKLRNALTHSSFAASPQESYERMEFLGDAVLELVVTEHLFEQYDMNEGDMSRMRAAAVCEAALCLVARDFALSDYLQIGKGEAATGGKYKASILADAVEAIIGAVFLDGGWEKAKAFVLSFAARSVADAAEGKRADYKTELQELLQSRGRAAISYQAISEEGPEHNKYFNVAVYNDGSLLGKGGGASKKEAEQQAAQNALKRL